MASVQKDMPVMEPGPDRIVLFYPYISPGGIQEVAHTLNSRWIGQGPKVELFEQRFSSRFAQGNPAISVGSGTDALHLAYLLAGVSAGDEVVVPVFTCTATNIPLLYIGAKPVFADIQPHSLNIDPNHVRQLVNSRTRAIVCVHYGGLPCDMNELRMIASEYGIPLIQDAAHGLGATYWEKPIGMLSDFAIYSFQAIKHFTTGDGGMITLNNPGYTEKLKRLRWFGIDRMAKQAGVWENDIYEIGYKYQMTDIAAALGIAALDDFDRILSHRRLLLHTYKEHLQGIPGIQLLGASYTDREHAAWLATIAVEDRRLDLQKKLYQHGIESNQVHYRNDRYTIFGGRQKNLPNMDTLEEKYLVLPIHHKVSTDDVRRICKIIRGGW